MTEPPKGQDYSRLIERLSNEIHVLEDRWDSVLAQRPELQEQVQLRFTVTRSIFEDGLLSLQRCFGFGLPSTFAEVFPVAYVVVASVNLLHRPNKDYDWDALTEDMVRWGQLILNDSDRALYMQVMQLLWTRGAFSPDTLHVPRNQALSERPLHPVQVNSGNLHDQWHLFKQRRVLRESVNLLNGKASHHISSL